MGKRMGTAKLEKPNKANSYFNKVKRFGLDIFLWISAATICLIWRVAADKESIWGYIWNLLALMALWLMVAFGTRLYRSYKTTPLWQALLSLAGTTALLLLANYYLFPLIFSPFSTTPGVWVISVVAVCDLLVILTEHYWKYATNMTVPAMQIEQRAGATVTRPDEERSEVSKETIHQSVLSITTEEDYQLLVEKARLNNRQTKIVANRDRFSLLQLPDYQYKTIVDLTLLNDAKGINRRFCIVNQKLPDEGCYVCCYRPQEYIKQKILRRYPKPLNWVVYTCYFFWKRIVPRLLFTSRLYYDITKGRKRMLSKTEVYGRLYYCGFEVDECVTMGHIEYIFAHRHSQPYPQEQIKVYGPLIKLRRVGKDGNFLYIYKFRTMHPYAEYIQKYVFDQRGGMDIADKSNDDWRITTWGRFMRKYWLDELPMVLNWLRGDVKLVGVRPLSKTMFDTYPPALQAKRTQCKPGLIPPFYIDHPKTFEELFASEDKYLDAYLQHPIRTDVRYFFLTIRSILFRGMHSA